MSTPPNVVFRKDGPFTYKYDDSLGKGQTIFILDDGLNDIPEVCDHHNAPTLATG